MARKVLLGWTAAALALAGCTTPKEKPAPAATATVAPKPKPAPAPVAPKAKPRPAPRSSSPPPTPTPAPARAELPGMIQSGAQWTSPGFQSLSVRQGGPIQPVPIFRQAGTLASVRAALAGSPAMPQAEFRNGVLTLKFDRGSNAEIASAVNKTLSVAGTRNLQVTLPP